MTEIMAAFMIFLASLMSSGAEDYSANLNDYDVNVETSDRSGRPVGRITFKAKEGATKV